MNYNLLLSFAVATGCATSRPRPAEISNTPPPAAPASAAEADRPAPECRGDALELTGLAMSHRCDVGGTGAELPSSVEVSLEATELEARSGDLAETALLLSNHGAAAVRLRLDASCRFANLVDVHIYTPHGQRLDRYGAERCVEHQHSCAGHVIEVTLSPGGVARIPFSFPARVALADSISCEAHPGRALSAGRYRAVISTPLAPEPLTAALRVEAIRRLPVSRCRGYARELAELAEPDPARRGEVAAQVAERCRRAPPRQSLVDCQLSSRSEAELAACTEGER